MVKKIINVGSKRALKQLLMLFAEFLWGFRQTGWQVGKKTGGMAYKKADSSSLYVGRQVGRKA